MARFRFLNFTVVVLFLAVTNFTCIPSASYSAPNDDLVVQTTKGKIEGNKRTNGGAEFLGIPYAQPPFGNLRWHEPVPMQPWSDVRPTKTFGAPCSQPVLGDWNRRDSETSSEDC